jgi:multiple sugar transport system substrate-binding protein
MVRRRIRLLVLVLALALAGVACGGDGGGEEEAAAPAEGPVTLTMAENAVRGGKNAAIAEYLLDYAIPTFEERMAAEGREVTVEFTESGVDDEDYKSRLALDLSVGEGPDVIGFDSFWVSEFV